MKQYILYKLTLGKYDTYFKNLLGGIPCSVLESAKGDAMKFDGVASARRFARLNGLSGYKPIPA